MLLLHFTQKELDVATSVCYQGCEVLQRGRHLILTKAVISQTQLVADENREEDNYNNNLLVNLLVSGTKKIKMKPQI